MKITFHELAKSQLIKLGDFFKFLWPFQNTLILRYLTIHQFFTIVQFEMNLNRLQTSDVQLRYHAATFQWYFGIYWSKKYYAFCGVSF